MLYRCCLCLLDRRLRHHRLPALLNPPARAAEGSSAMTRTLDPRRARAVAQSMMQLHPPLLFVGANATLPAICRLPSPCRSSRCRRDASGGPPPLQSFRNSCSTTHGSTPQSPTSWARDDAQLPSSLPLSGPTPPFICTLSLLSLRRGPPSLRRSRRR